MKRYLGNYDNNEKTPEKRRFIYFKGSKQFCPVGQITPNDCYLSIFKAFFFFFLGGGGANEN